MSVPYEIACTLKYLANGMPGAEYTYNHDGTVTVSEVPGDIEGDVAKAKSVIETSRRWGRMLDVMVDLDLSVDLEDVQVEKINEGGEFKIEFILAGAMFKFAYNKATGVLTTKARDEAVISYGLYRYLYDVIEQWVNLLPEEV